MEERKIIRIGAISNNSAGESVVTPTELVKLAAANGEGALALADYDAAGGFKEFSRAAAEYGIKPIFGVRIKTEHEEKEENLILLAKNRKGLEAIFDIIAKAEIRKKDILANYKRICACRENVLVGISKTFKDVLGEDDPFAFADFMELETAHIFCESRKTIDGLVALARENGKYIVPDANGNCITDDDRLCGKILKGEDYKPKYINTFGYSRVLSCFGKDAADFFADSAEAIEKQIESIDFDAQCPEEATEKAAADVEKLLENNGIFFIRDQIEGNRIKFFVSHFEARAIYAAFADKYGPKRIAFGISREQNRHPLLKLDEFLRKRNIVLSAGRRKALDDKLLNAQTFFRMWAHVDEEKLLIAPENEKIASLAPVDNYPSALAETPDSVIVVSLRELNELNELKKLTETAGEPKNAPKQSVPMFFRDMNGIGCACDFAEVKNKIPGNFNELVKLYEEEQQSRLKDSDGEAIEVVNVPEYLKICLKLWQYKQTNPVEFYAAALTCLFPCFKTEPLTQGLKEVVDARDDALIQYALGDIMAPVAVEAYDVALECYHKKIKFLPPDEKLSHETEFLPENGAIRLPLGEKIELE